MTPRLRDRAAVATFLVALLVPMLYRAAVASRPWPGVPRVLSDLQAISCLFSDKPDGWAFFYVQVRYPGERSFQSIDPSELFPLEPFGHRTRLHRLLQAWDRRPGRGTEELSRWFFRRFEELHPDERQPDALRIAWSWSVPDPTTPPTGAWTVPDFRSLRADRRRVIATYERGP